MKGFACTEPRDISILASLSKAQPLSYLWSTSQFVTKKISVLLTPHQVLAPPELGVMLAFGVVKAW